MTPNRLKIILTILHCSHIVIFAQVPKIIINEFLTSNAHINYDPDFIQYSDWIELLNKEDFNINLNGYYFTDDLANSKKWQINQDITIPANGFLVFTADGENEGSHIGFKLNREGEQIGLYTPNGSVLDSISFGNQLTDVSSGRNPVNESEWLYFADPTPGTINNNKGILSQVICETPIFSISSGFYANALSLEIYSNDNAEIRYTLDGSEPNENSILYVSHINIFDRSIEPNYYSAIPTNANPYSWIQPWRPPNDIVRKASIIRARSFDNNRLPSKIVTNTYFIGSDLLNRYKNIPVISLISDEKHLFSESTGIYVPGNRFNGNQGTGNYFNNWNKPAHIQLFNEEGNLQISQEVDIRTQGLSSKVNPQKGLHIIARNKYGIDSINYPFFKNRSSSANKISSFKRIIIRAWGSNWQYAMLTDAFAHTIYAKSTLDIQDYCPTVVFINGEYWGLQEIREANKNPYYYYEHYGIGINNPGIDLLQLQGEFIDEGDDDHWQNMIDFLNNSDIVNHNNYEYLQTQMDITNFIDYIGHTVYCGKFDWPGQNEAMWRPRTSDGKWKWIQYDMDTSFGINGNYGPYYNMIKHTIHNGNNNKGAHPILVILLNNNDFKNQFINWFMDRINSDFLPEVVKGKLDNVVSEIEILMDEHRARWALRNDSWLQWNYNLNLIYEYIRLKPDILVTHLQDEFDLDGTVNVSVNVNDLNGTVKINTLLIDDSTEGIQNSPYPWSGKYFKDVPITLFARPTEGFVFDHWEGSINSTNDSVTFTLTDDAEFIAIFIPVNKIDSIVLNEVLTANINIVKDTAGDYDSWIELYNSGEDSIDLKGLYLTDDFSIPTKWKIPQVDSVSFNIRPKGYQIFWCDSETDEGFDHTEFSLKDRGGQIGLVQITGKDTVYIDSIEYPHLSPNISFGRLPTSPTNWKTLLTPTPGAINIYQTSMEELTNSPTLLQNYPNPFNNFTLIPVYLSDLRIYRVSIFDIKGNLIKEYNFDGQISGLRSIIWDGLDFQGKIVSSGIYFYSLFSDNKLIQTKKMLFIK